MIQFDLPKDQSSIIKVIGVGGGGSNAVNYMHSQNISGVDFIICNTDAQAIAHSNVPNKIQLGPTLTQGLGAGANPEIGKQATEESLDEIKRILEVNTKMTFITAGMGGGTGTGGAPILAKICKDLNILTVGIITTPFAYEGKKRLEQAETGINKLKDYVDTLIVISNDKLRHQFGNLKMKEAFAKADNVLATAAKCITDVINSTGQINVDFADVCTVMKNGGVAILGSATATGDNRAQIAIENAINSPLLNDSDIRGAKWILININSAEGEHEFTMDEVEIIQTYLKSQAGEDSDIILGLGYDNTLGDEISITLIATGFEYKNPFAKEQISIQAEKSDKIIMPLEMPNANTHVIRNVKKVDEHIAKVEQPTLQFDDAKQEPSIESNYANDSMMPRLAEEEVTNVADIKNSELESDSPVFFEISSSSDQAPIIIFDTPANIESEKRIEKEERKALEIISAASNKFLAKPTQIYAAERKQIIAELPKIEEQPIILNLPQEENFEEMKLIEKPLVNQNENSFPQNNNQNIESNQSQQEVEETEQLRMRAMERIAKLRNLSFNINAADPNSEFETVPAYLRRNLEIQNPVADVENFYSKYTVKNDDSEQAEINTINSFLDGKQPD